MYRQSGDLLLVPTTREEVGPTRDYVGLLEVCPDGTKVLVLGQALEFKHKEEETVRVPPGMYVLKGDDNWGGAPINGR